MYDIIIVGAGTAGLTAAIYGVRAGKSVLVLEAKTYGGQIINTPKIENYPGIKEISGFEYAKNLYEQAKDLGAEIRFEQVTAIETAESRKLVKTTKDSYECRSVILATGAKNRPLSLPREQELIGAGVSYCATDDGAVPDLYTGKHHRLVADPYIVAHHNVSPVVPSLGHPARGQIPLLKKQRKRIGGQRPQRMVCAVE